MRVVLVALLAFAFSVERCESSPIVNLTLTPGALNATPGLTIEFDGTLTNSGTDNVFLNGDEGILFDPTLTFDDSVFFANTPLFLAPGEVYSGPLFSIIVSIAALPGLRTGSFTPKGGADSNEFSDLAIATFQVDVQANSSAVPEPATMILLGPCAAGWYLTKRRRIRPDKGKEHTF